MESRTRISMLEGSREFGILSWEIPWMEDPGELQSIGLQRAGHALAMKQQGLPVCVCKVL